MDLYELRLDKPHPGTRDGDPGHGRVCQLPHPPRARAGRAPGAVAGTASRDESSMSDRARAQVTTPEALPDERLTDAALRPSRLDEFVGQAKVKESLQIAIDAAKQRREPLDHTLFFGPPGLGKTTLALLMAKELGVNIRTTSGPVLERPGDLVGLLTSLGPGDILFIDEVHRLRPVLEEFLYPAMEDYRVDVRIADGPHAQTIPMALERFTLIGATTRFGLLTPPMRARFGLVERLAYYPPDDVAQIISRSAGILDVPTDAAGITEIARRSRGTPRVANRLLKRVRDYAQVRAGGKITAPGPPARRDPALEARARLRAGARRREDHGAGRSRGVEAARRGRVRARRHGRPDLEDHHRAVRGWTGRAHHHRRRRGRGSGHARGSVRAVPHAAGLPRPHATRPVRHGIRVPTFRIHAAPER